MKIIECQQGSSEWWEARRGVATASEFSRIITSVKGNLSAAADNYICELLAEKFHVGPAEELAGFCSKAMRNGSECEPQARAWYEMVNHVKVEEVGFILSDCGRVGCSPDGLIGEDGGLELKCPHGKTHLRYCLDGTLPEEYKAQVHGALAITGRAWWDFLSYVPGLPPFCIRVEPDDFTEQLRRALEEFHARYLEIQDLLGLAEPVAA